LPYSTTEAELTDFFSKAGQVDSAAIISDRMSGRSKGFGFVEMASEGEAQKAIEMFNGKEIDGKNVTVNEARPMEARPRRDGFNRGGNRGFGGERRDRW